MDLTLKKVVKYLLKKYGAYPSKRFGQNFLIDKSALKKIVESANLHLKDIVLEIGPGIGTLTKEIAKKVKRVIAIEKDKKMIEILKETLNDFKNVKIIQEDILKIDPKYYILNTKHYKIVANLPYYIVSPVIRKFLESKNPPEFMILMVQKEVAQRICSKPPKMSLLAVSVQFHAKPKIISFVLKKSFWPQPKVDGAIIELSKIRSQKSKIFTDLFFKIVKAGFSQPRKQLANNLSKGLELDKERIKKWLLKNKIKPTQRAETLSVQDWIKLTKNFKWKIQRQKKET
ncbi:ribosomal RNA small subunit methyltransferase A [Patescibacteria group bacterium]|nr:ribosomal RNA small subunit methyltransferase A [Patescibacteria group bacterium]